MQTARVRSASFAPGRLVVLTMQTSGTPARSVHELAVALSVIEEAPMSKPAPASPLHKCP